MNIWNGLAPYISTYGRVIYLHQPPLTFYDSFWTTELTGILGCGCTGANCTCFASQSLRLRIYSGRLTITVAIEPRKVLF